MAAPEATARRLLAHCGLPWDPAVLAFHTSNRTVATASVVQVRQPLYTKAVGRWRKYERQLAPLAAAVAAEVRQYEAEVEVAVRRAVAAQRRLQEAAEAAEASKAAAETEGRKAAAEGRKAAKAAEGKEGGREGRKEEGQGGSSGRGQARGKEAGEGGRTDSSRSEL